jgi:hypothetical protein
MSSADYKWYEANLMDWDKASADDEAKIKELDKVAADYKVKSIELDSLLAKNERDEEKLADLAKELEDHLIQKAAAKNAEDSIHVADHEVYFTYTTLLYVVSIN